MGDSAATSRGIREIHEASKSPLTTTYLAYDSPCYCLEVAVRSFLKCLGLTSDPCSSSSSSEEEEDRNPPSITMDDPPTTKTETGTTEAIVEAASTRRRPNVQRPTRPPISTGRPGQTNVASS